MSAFFVAEINVHDSEKYARYIEKARPIILSQGGEYIIRSGNVTCAWGDWKPNRFLVIKFASKQAVEDCFSSPEYVSIKYLREEASVSRAMIIED